MYQISVKKKGFQDTTIEERTMYTMAELGELAEVILKRDKIQDAKKRNRFRNV